MRRSAAAAGARLDHLKQQSVAATAGLAGFPFLSQYLYVRKIPRGQTDQRAQNSIVGAPSERDTETMNAGARVNATSTDQRRMGQFHMNQS